MKLGIHRLAGQIHSAFGGVLLVLLFVAPACAQPLRVPNKAAPNRALPKQAAPPREGPFAVDNATLVERLSEMPPVQRKRLLERMAPQRRALIEKRLEQYNAIKPEDRIKLKKAYEDFQNLPLEKQAEARQIFRDVADLEPARRQQVRAAITRLRPFTGRDLERRLNSQVFLDRFNSAEQALIVQALQVLGPLSPSTAADPQ